MIKIDIATGDDGATYHVNVYVLGILVEKIMGPMTLEEARALADALAKDGMEVLNRPR